MRITLARRVGVCLSVLLLTSLGILAGSHEQIASKTGPGLFVSEGIGHSYLPAGVRSYQ